jgi:hypothetical protein
MVEYQHQSLITIHRSLITSRDFYGAIASGVIVTGFCLLLLWHDPLLFWNDDYQISVLPVFADVARSWSEGHLPLLSPYSWVCSNLAGEFQYGTFSVFVNAAVILIWKFPLSFPQQAAALSMVHLFVLAAGAFLLARDRILSVALSTMVALVAALNGWIICWGATDWFGALGAFAWLPWAWWGLERSLDQTRSKWRFLWPAPFVYLLIAGGFPYTVLMLGLLAAWLIIKSLGETRVLSSIWPLLLGLFLGLGLAAPAWLALLDYIHGSARQAQPASAHFQWLVPFAALPGFILPCWTVNWMDFSSRLTPHTASELACGLVPPVALLAALIVHGRALVRQIKWELVLLVLVLVLAMVPTINVFRWSFRWLPFFHLVLALCAAEALRLSVPRRGWFTKPGTVGFVLISIVAIIMLATGAGGFFAFPFTWIMLALAAMWAATEALVGRDSVEPSRRNSARQSLALPVFSEWTPPVLTLAAFLATYLCIPTNPGVPKYNLSETLMNAAPLDPSRLYLSVYPPPEFAYRIEEAPGTVGQVVRLGSTSMWGGVRLINGYSPIRPAGVAREFGAEIHGEIDPGIADYLLGWQAGPAGRLAQLGIDGILVAKQIALVPKPESEWTLAFSSEEGRVYHRRGEPSPRIRSLISIDSRPNEQFAPASIKVIDNSRNRVEAEVSVPANGKPALLTFSRPYFRGYQAMVGGHALPVTSFRGLSPLVELPPGTNGQLILRYRPWWLVAGSATAVACATVCLAGLALGWRGGARRIVPKSNNAVTIS